MLREFRKFIERGNVLELAVAVILGVAFNDVVRAFTDTIFSRLITVLTGGARPAFDYSVEVRGVPIEYGAFLTALMNFLIIAFAAFVLVKAANAARNLRGAADEEEKETELDVLEDIRDILAGERGGGVITVKAN